MDHDPPGSLSIGFSRQEFGSGSRRSLFSVTFTILRCPSQVSVECSPFVDLTGFLMMRLELPSFFKVVKSKTAACVDRIAYVIVDVVFCTMFGLKQHFVGG